MLPPPPFSVESLCSPSDPQIEVGSAGTSCHVGRSVGDLSYSSSAAHEIRLLRLKLTVLRLRRTTAHRHLASHHVVSQRRNSIQGVQLFGRGGAHRSEVADVAIVAVAGRRISFFEFTLTPARASASSLCDLRVT